MSEDIQLNADPTKRYVVHPLDMEWQPSPSPSVWRRRLSLSGPKEAGRVTSIVRYDPNSEFHEHNHPEGEEILVLEGAWQDANGNHSAGTFMLNPEGFIHAPRSKDGCVLLVKLRQFGGENRQHVRIETEGMPWTEGKRSLYVDESGTHRETIRMEKWAPGQEAKVGGGSMPVEVVIVKGGAVESGDILKLWSWVRLPPGTQGSFVADSESGCEVYIKEGEWFNSN